MSVSNQQIIADAKAIARLGGPLLANNLSVMGMAFADTVMAGRLSPQDLAGLAIGVAYWNLFFYIALGALMAISPSVAHAFGANDSASVTRFARQAWWIAVVLAVALVAGLMQVDRVLPALHIAPDILPIAIDYVHAVEWGMPAAVGFFALRYTTEGLGRTKPIMYVGLIGLACNVFGNWLFMFGKLGVPHMGAVGAGVATAISLWIMCFLLAAHMHVHRAYRAYAFFARIDAPEAKPIRDLLRVGIPIAGSVLAEGGLFVAAALIMGSMGAISAGAHQIALNYAAFMFMVPLAISSATTIHVGHILGRNEPRAARAAGFVGIGLCAIVMAGSALVILFCNTQIAELYTSDKAVADLAAALLLYAALFQISDGLQVGASGALRAFKDTALPMVLCVISYWAVGFALAYQRGVVQRVGPPGVWLGLTVGLTVSAVLLIARYYWTSLKTTQSFLRSL
jgi:MATE family multidrug resistance protein